MQRIGKALPAGGIWGHALPDKFQNSVVAEICVFMHSEAADNFGHLPKKDTFSRQFNQFTEHSSFCNASWDDSCF